MDGLLGELCEFEIDKVLKNQNLFYVIFSCNQYVMKKQNLFYVIFR